MGTLALVIGFVALVVFTWLPLAGPNPLGLLLAPLVSSEPADVDLLPRSFRVSLTIKRIWV